MTNEIPQLETAHLGIGNNNQNRGNRIMPGLLSFNSGPGPLGGILPGGDPGGWVSLAALSRTQVGTRINTVYTPGSGPGTGIGTTQQNFNPVLRLPASGNRRPAEPNIFDQGFQFNTVAVPSRPFFSSNHSIFLFIENFIIINSCVISRQFHHWVRKQSSTM